MVGSPILGMKDLWEVLYIIILLKVRSRISIGNKAFLSLALDPTSFI